MGPLFTGVRQAIGLKKRRSHRLAGQTTPSAGGRRPSATKGASGDPGGERVQAAAGLSTHGRLEPASRDRSPAEDGFARRARWFARRGWGVGDQKRSKQVGQSFRPKAIGLGRELRLEDRTGTDSRGFVLLPLNTSDEGMPYTGPTVRGEALCVVRPAWASALCLVELGWVCNKSRETCALNKPRQVDPPGATQTSLPMMSYTPSCVVVLHCREGRFSPSNLAT